MSTAPRSLRSRPKSGAHAGKLTLITDGPPLVVPPDVRTFAGFRAWASADDFPEHVRVTFFEGEVVLDMSNEEINAHVGLKTELISALGALVDQLGLGHLYGSGALVSNEAAEMANNSDALLLGRASLEAGRVRVVPQKGVEGTPDWVLEVISEGSVRKDKVLLRDAYHRAGVPEYWLVDARGEEMSFQVLNHLETGYVASPVRDGWQRSKVFGRSFRLARTLDDFGLWEYTLHVRED